MIPSMLPTFSIDFAAQDLYTAFACQKPSSAHISFHEVSLPPGDPAAVPSAWQARGGAGLRGPTPRALRGSGSRKLLGAANPPALSEECAPRGRRARWEAESQAVLSLARPLGPDAPTPTPTLPEECQSVCTDF